MFENKLDGIIYSYDKKTFLFVDNSNYLDYPDFPILEIITPSESKHTLSYNPNSSTILNSRVLFDTDEDNDLADGIYKFKQSVSPNEKVFKCFFVLKTSKVDEKIKNLLEKLTHYEESLINKIFYLDLLKEGAKISVEKGDLSLGVEKYNLLKKELDRLDCK